MVKIKYERNSRLGVAAHNAMLTFAFQFLFLLVSFICRTVFTYTLGTEYLGINGLFSNVLYVLSFVELGLGNAIVYKLYRPLSEGNQSMVRIYLGYYKKIYYYIMLIVTILGVAFIPFLKFIVKSKVAYSDLYILYILFLVDTVISYAYVYKKSILIADQKNYVVDALGLIFNILLNVFQIVVVLLTHAFISYLIVKIIFDLLCNFAIAKKADALYPYIKGIDKSISLPKDDIIEFHENLKGLFMEKLASVSFGGTDNIFISVFCGIASVGIVSQYVMILNAANMLLNKVLGAMTSAIGKLNVEADGNHVEKVFRALFFANALVYGLIFIYMSDFLDYFVTEIWLDNEYYLEMIPLISIVLETCLRGIYYPIYMVRSAYGFFSQFRIFAVVAAITNIILDFVLGRWLGITGIFVATMVSRGMVSIIDIYVVYHYGFRIKVSGFVDLVIKFFIFFAATITINKYCVMHYFWKNTYICAFKCLLVITILYGICIIIFFHKTDEYRYYRGLLKNKRRNR